MTARIGIAWKTVPLRKGMVYVSGKPSPGTVNMLGIRIGKISLQWNKNRRFLLLPGTLYLREASLVLICGFFMRKVFSCRTGERGGNTTGRVPASANLCVILAKSVFDRMCRRMR